MERKVAVNKTANAYRRGRAWALAECEEINLCVLQERILGVRNVSLLATVMCLLIQAES